MQARVEERSRRIVIARLGEMELADARHLARAMLTRIRAGADCRAAGSPPGYPGSYTEDVKPLNGAEARGRKPSPDRRLLKAVLDHNRRNTEGQWYWLNDWRREKQEAQARFTRRDVAERRRHRDAPFT